MRCNYYVNVSGSLLLVYEIYGLTGFIGLLREMERGAEKSICGMKRRPGAKAP
jgi:hypothetical protein